MARYDMFGHDKREIKKALEKARPKKKGKSLKERIQDKSPTKVTPMPWKKGMKPKYKPMPYKPSDKPKYDIPLKKKKK